MPPTDQEPPTRLSAAAAPRLPGIGTAMESMIAVEEIAGAVTAVVGRDGLLHLETTGLADRASGRPMLPDTHFWIASMTKPVTGLAVMMLVDEGKIAVEDPVERFVPEFAALATPCGLPARLTIRQILTHTSGLGEAPWLAAREARTLADLVPAWLAAPMQHEPGERWTYTQSGINLAARVVEIVSGMPFDAFLHDRLFAPLGMTDTTFYPNRAQRERLATGYFFSREAGRLVTAIPRREYGDPTRPPLGNGGLFSTVEDLIPLCRLLLQAGATPDGRRLVGAEAIATLGSVHTGDLPTGFLQDAASGNLGRHYGWGLAASVLRIPHGGAAAGLSAGSYGHGGAWGTQLWVDPQRGIATLLLIQRANFATSDGSVVRQAFQQAVAAAIGSA
jgi:CubicO group peptidase (beta-lactamase class C family)